MSAVQLVACNAGCKLTSEDSIAAFIDSFPRADGIFVPEFNVSIYDSNPYEMFLPGVRIHIWNPGPGSFNCAWIVRESVESAFLKFTGLGRTASVIFRAASGHKLICIGAHVAHGFEAQQTLHELSAQSHVASRGDRVAIVGDLNIDLLPVSSLDPFSHLPQRQHKHRDRRSMLYTFLDSNHLCINEPAVVLSVPSDAHDYLYFVPATRLPQGNQSGVASLLDCCLSSEGLVKNSWICWTSSPSDHAAVGYELDVSIVTHRATG